MDERRTYRRSAAYFPLRYRRAADEGPATAELRDLSGGGMGLTLKEPFAVGTKLLLEMDLLDRGPWVTMVGEITWSEPAVRGRDSAVREPIATGVKFVRINAADPRLYRQLFREPAAA